MKKYFQIFQIAVLLILFFLGDTLIRKHQGDSIFQFLIAALVAIGYSLWGILIHIISRDLYVKIVLEYILVSLVVLTLFSILILT
jgi:hypothetical protein